MSAPFINHHQIEAGRTNRACVLVWQLKHPWGTQTECAKALGLSPMAVNRHVKAIREEWRLTAAGGGCMIVAAKGSRVSGY